MYEDACAQGQGQLLLLYAVMLLVREMVEGSRTTRNAALLDWDYAHNAKAAAQHRGWWWNRPSIPPPMSSIAASQPGSSTLPGSHADCYSKSQHSVTQTQQALPFPANAHCCAAPLQSYFHPGM